MILPWPFGLIAALGIFIAFPLYLRKRYMRGVGGYGRGEGSRGFFGFNSDQPIVKYVCLVCSHRFKGGSCPRCGSKAKRADF